MLTTFCKMDKLKPRIQFVKRRIPFDIFAESPMLFSRCSIHSHSFWNVDSKNILVIVVILIAAICVVLTFILDGIIKFEFDRTKTISQQINNNNNKITSTKTQNNKFNGASWNASNQTNEQKEKKKFFYPFNQQNERQIFWIFSRQKFFLLSLPLETNANNNKNHILLFLRLLLLLYLFFFFSFHLIWRIRC